MKKILALIAALAFAAAPAFAQTAPVDPAATEAAKQLFLAMNLKQVMTQTMQQAEQSMPLMMRNTVTSLINGDPKMTPEKKQKALADLDKSVPKMQATFHAMFSDPSMLDDMLAAMVPVYASTYTVAEMQQLAAFYQSPVGQKMQANVAKMQAASMEIAGRVLIPRMQKMIQETANGIVANQQ